MTTANTIDPKKPSSKLDRLQKAHLVQRYNRSPLSLRHLASDHPISTSALQRAVAQFPSHPTEQDTFFLSPAGLDWLRRLLYAAHTTFSLMGNCGLRLVALFIELCGLDRYIANSLGSHHNYSRLLQEQILLADKDFHQDVRPDPHNEPPRQIDISADENFHHKTPVLVAVETQSGYVLTCLHAKRRDLNTWQHVLQGTLDTLHLTARQLVTDAATALKALAKALEADWSEDLFHIHNHLSKALGLKVFVQHKRNENKLMEAKEDMAQASQQFLDSNSKPLRMLSKIDKTRERVAEAKTKAEESERGAAWLSKVHRELSMMDHALEPQTGHCRDEEQVAEQHKSWIKSVQEGLKEYLSEEKAASLCCTLKSGLQSLSSRQESFKKRLNSVLEGVEEENKEAFVKGAVGQAYFCRYIRSSEPDDWARQGHQRARAFWEQASSSMSEAVKSRLEALGSEVAMSWQRCSSSVEGFNGMLSLRYQIKGRLSQGRLDVAKALHNLMVKDRWGRTPFMRLFRCEQPSLFERVLERLPVPPPPRRRVSA